MTVLAQAEPFCQAYFFFDLSVVDLTRLNF